MEVVRDGEAEEVSTNGKQRWALSPSTILRLTMSQASTEASSDKVPRQGSPAPELQDPRDGAQQSSPVPGELRAVFSPNFLIII